MFREVIDDFTKLHDRIKNGELEIEYCPTDDMVADYFTKPLQGKKFLQFPRSRLRRG